VRFLYAAFGSLTITIDTRTAVSAGGASLQQGYFDYLFVDTQPVEIKIEYVPAADSQLELLWQYPALVGSGFAIPSAAFLAPLSAALDHGQVTVSPGLISSQSVLSAVTTSFVTGASGYLTITTKDDYGNLVSAQAACRPPGGTAPSCLFDIYLDQPDGTPTPTIAFWGNGVYSADITFATTGMKLVHVEIITGAATRATVTGSPITITVT
jgi:hypothetical protein